MENTLALRKEAVLLEPTVRIGKNGITDSVILEISALLRKRGLVKVKILRSAFGEENAPHSPAAPSKEDIINETVKKTHSRLIQKVGMTFTIYREKDPTGK